MFWNALGSSPGKLENEKWPNVPFGVLGHSYFTIRTTKGYRTKRVGFIGDGASKLLAPSLF